MLAENISIMSKRTKNTESPTTKAKESALPLIELESLGEIIKRIQRVVDEQRGRASLLFLSSEPIPIDLRYRYEDTSRGYILRHDAPETDNKAEKGVVACDVRDIAAMAFRESLRASKLNETRDNIKRMLDFVVGTLFADTRTSDGQKRLTSANRRTISQTINSSEAKKHPTIRKALTLFFLENYLNPESKEQLLLQTGRDKGVLSAVDAMCVVSQGLKSKKDQKGHNRIFDHLVKPGITLKLKHNGKSRSISALKLIENYLQVARRSTLERANNIEPDFDTIQVERAIDAIIGEETMERSASKTPEEIVAAIEESISKSVDPILWGAVAA